jgi:hypothetical protein
MIKNPYTTLEDQAKFNSLTEADKKFYSSGADINDPYVALRAPNRGISSEELKKNPTAAKDLAWPPSQQPVLDSGWTEPESAANADVQPIYPYNNVTQTESGHFMEMDDTPKRERVRLQHRTGTFIEMHPNGDEVHKVYGDGYEITVKNKNVLIKGRCSVSIEGDCNMDVKGSYNLQVAKDYNLLVGGKVNIRGKKDITLDGGGDVEILANENFGGTLRLGAADSLYLASDLVVGGSIQADVITAESRLATGPLGGVTAGSAGFVSVLGGLSIGIPIAVPGSVFAIGTGTFGISVTSPFGSFILSQAVLATDRINRQLDNIHRHPVKGGLSGTRRPKAV